LPADFPTKFATDDAAFIATQYSAFNAAELPAKCSAIKTTVHYSFITALCATLDSTNTATVYSAQHATFCATFEPSKLPAFKPAFVPTD
jgi:hypothetical protein